MRDFNVYASAIDILFSHSRAHNLWNSINVPSQDYTLDGCKKNNIW